MADPAFIALSVITVIGAILALEAKELIYGALALGLSLSGMAGLFILLDAPFPAAFQITVYVGAVVVLILFTIMLVRREKWMQIGEKVAIPGVAGALAIVLGFGFLAYQSGFINSTGKENVVSSISVIGDQILSAYWPVLLVLALVLTASIVGALTLSKVEKE
ncbi:MAG: NADH-quinone oxidoreductase subunit J [Thaumarchaeota archaeon]|nr:NADH-quinone oxidoreductase subunit J [Nitrososphaerota archaeon]